MLIRAMNKITAENDPEIDGQTRSIFRRIHEMPSGSDLTTRAMYEIKRNILKRLLRRLNQAKFDSQ